MGMRASTRACLTCEFDPIVTFRCRVVLVKRVRSRMLPVPHCAPETICRDAKSTPVADRCRRCELWLATASDNRFFSDTLLDSSSTSPHVVPFFTSFSDVHWCPCGSTHDFWWSTHVGPPQARGSFTH